jgi:pimeloyl-ACP methyl ester carboxylesterase
VPTLAKAIVLGNAAMVNPQINLKGISVGNGCLGLEAGLCSFDNGVEININLPYFRGHGLISASTWEAAQADCPMGTDPGTLSPACAAQVDAAHQEVGPVNIYDIYAPCITGPGSHKTLRTSGLASRAPVRLHESGPVECIDETIAVYIGSPEVAAALHVIPTLHWAVCGSNSSFDYTRTELDERIDVYPVVVNAGVRVMILNGEADACVPFIDNELWTRSMNYSVVKPWQPWLTNSQVSGYVIEYANSFTFATIKGAGHMVPGTRPVESLAMFRKFLAGTPLA